MLVQIRDRDAMLSLPIVNLSAYLNATDWSNQGAWGSRPAVIYAKEHGGREWEILVPTRDTVADYAEGMAEAVAVLAAVESRSQLDVYYDLLGAGADVIRVRSMNGIAGKPLSLRRSAGLLNDAYTMVASAARAAENPQAVYRGSMSSDVAEYLDNVRPLPGYHEGYAITLHSPVPAGFGTQQDFGDDYTLPFPRRATVKLAAALEHSGSAISKAVVEDTLQPFREAVPNGVSANLCSSIAELAKKGGGVEIGLTWAQVRPSNAPAATFQFSEESVDVLKEAVMLLRHEPSIGERIIARVAGLEQGQDAFGARAQLSSVLDDLPAGIDVLLDQSSYGAVIRAFEQREIISVVGDIHWAGNAYELRNPHSLLVAPEELPELQIAP